MQKFWSAKPNCHVSNPYGCDDAQKTLGFWNTIGAAYELAYFQKVFGNDEKCFNNFNPYQAYWKTIRPNLLIEFSGAI